MARILQRRVGFHLTVIGFALWKNPRHPSNLSRRSIDVGGSAVLVASGSRVSFGAIVGIRLLSSVILRGTCIRYKEGRFEIAHFRRSAIENRRSLFASAR